MILHLNIHLPFLCLAQIYAPNFHFLLVPLVKQWPGASRFLFFATLAFENSRAVLDLPALTISLPRYAYLSLSFHPNQNIENLISSQFNQDNTGFFFFLANGFYKENQYFGVLHTSSLPVL
jgi:hypothetical protein